MYRIKDTLTTPAITSNIGPIRKQRGVSAAELAAEAGVTRQTIYAVENGTYIPNTAVGLRLARALGVTVEELFSLPEETSETQGPVARVFAIPGSARLEAGQAIQATKLRGKLVASAAAPATWYFPPSDGFVTAQAADHGRFQIQLDRPNEEFESRIVVAGCDPGMSLLARCAEQAGHPLMLLYRNSSDSLALLKSGLTHIAGSHLRDESSGESNLAAVHRILAASSVAIFSFASAQEGLLTASGNPKTICDVDDLARKDVVMINRERGSGSRKLLDRRMKKLGVDAEAVRGYSKTVPGHMAAAWEVKAGNADCCLATEPCARFLGLHFAPLESVRYDLVVRKADLKTPAISAFFDLLNQLPFRRKLNSVGGYETSVTGKRIQ